MFRWLRSLLWSSSAREEDAAPGKAAAQPSGEGTPQRVHDGDGDAFCFAQRVGPPKDAATPLRLGSGAARSGGAAGTLLRATSTQQQQEDGGEDAQRTPPVRFMMRDGQVVGILNTSSKHDETRPVPVHETTPFPERVANEMVRVLRVEHLAPLPPVTAHLGQQQEQRQQAAGIGGAEKRPLAA